MSKITLIRAVDPYYEMNFTQPVGLLYVAGALRDAGHEVRIIDNRLAGLDPRQVARECGDADLIGVSAMTCEAKNAYATANAIKALYPDKPLFLGGAHATMFGLDALNEAPFDACVRGEGEVTSVELVEALAAGEKPDGINGVTFRRNGEVIENPDRPFIDDLDTLPFPAYELLPIEKYFNLPTMGHFSRYPQYMSVFTSRACPYSCTYCHSIFGKKYRARSAEAILDEFSYLRRRFGIREYQILDDIFNLRKRRTTDVLEGLCNRNLNTSLIFPNGLRGDIMDDEQLDLFKRAGAFRIVYAVETASPRIQSMVKKNVKLDVLFDVISKTARRGIWTSGFFMLGFPTETADEMHATIDYACRSDFHTAAFLRLVPFKGTEIYKQVKEITGRDVKFSYDAYNYDYTPVNLSAVSDRQLEDFVRVAYRKFYLSKGRGLKLAFKFPNKRKLPMLARMFVNKVFTLDKEPHAKAGLHGSESAG